MGRRELIVQELSDAMDDPRAVDAVLRRHSDSKGVLYQALAEVLPIQEERLRRDAGKTAEARREKDTLQREAEALGARIEQLRQREVELEEATHRLDEEIKSKGATLAGAAALERGGFTSERLEQLDEALRSIAVAHQAQPQQVVDLFFQLLGSLDLPVALEAEVHRAEARLHAAKSDLERTEAERDALREEAEAHRGVLSALERLRKRGVEPDRLPNLDRLVRDSGASLSGLLRQLKRHGSIAKTAASLEKRRRALQGKAEQLQREIASLKAKHEEIQADLLDMRREMLALSIRRELARKEIANLGEVGDLARALSTKDPHQVGQASPDFPLYLLLWTRGWLEATGHGKLEVPAPLARRTRWVSLLFAPSLADLIDMALRILAAAGQEGRLALPPSG